jgi:ATP-dependent Clp protease ATP-binding subunit ClpC
VRVAEGGVVLELTVGAIDFLIKQGYNADYGARPLRRAIERHIEDPLAEHILRTEVPDKAPIRVDVAEEGDKLSFVPIEEPTEPVESGKGK